MDDAILDVCLCPLLLEFAEGHLDGFALHMLDLLAHDRIVHPVDEVIFRPLVLQDAEFGGDIILHFVVVAVEMVGGDVHDDGYSGLEVIHILELETGEFDDIDIMLLASHLKSHALANISSQADIQSCRLEDMIGQKGSGGLAVAAGDTHHLGIGVATGKLNLGDDRSTLLGEFLD